jgi:hypothetical protein
MSKQFQLYLTPSDAVALVRELRDRFGARLIGKKSSTSDPVQLESPLSAESIFEASGATSIYCYVAPTNGRIITEYYPRLGVWLTQTSSEAIEFSGCDFDGKTLRVGRFYFQTDDLVDGRIVKKPAEFLQWADRVFRYAKKVLKRDPEFGPLGAYIGKEALIFRESGGRFADSIEATGVPIRPPGSPNSGPKMVQ